LARGYFGRYRHHAARLLDTVDIWEDAELGRGGALGPWRARARRVLLALLDKEIVIRPFLRHPQTYGCRLPYYNELVDECMWLEKVVFRLECGARDPTFYQDIRTMFQNYVDYSTRVNPSHHRWVSLVLDLYASVCSPSGRGTEHRPEGEKDKEGLVMDGKGERFRKRGEVFEDLCAATDRERRRRIRQVEAACHARLTELVRGGASPGGGGTGALSFSRAAALKREYQRRVQTVRDRVVKRRRAGAPSGDPGRESAPSSPLSPKDKGCAPAEAPVHA
jgi:hypothetical protein